MTETTNQPLANKQPIADNYFGKKLVDDYRYMENFRDPVVQQWVKTQANFTINTLAQIPERNTFLNRLMELDTSSQAKVFDIIRLDSGKIFYLKIEPQDNISKLYMRKSMNEEEILLVNPHHSQRANNQTCVINGFKPSWDGKYIIYLISANGSEDALLHVMNTESLENIDRPISRITSFTMGICWLPNNQSFFYHRLQELKEGMAATEKYQKSQTCLHQLGEDIERDEVILEHGIAPLVNVTPIVWPYIPTTSDSGYAIALFYYGTQKEIDLYVSKVLSLTQNTPEWIKVCDVNDKIVHFTAHKEDIYLLTFKNASHFKIIKTSLIKPDLSKAETFLAESDSIINDMFAANDALYAIVTDIGIDKVTRITYDGQTKQLQLPSDGTVQFLNNDPRADGVMFSITTWTKSESQYEYNPTTNLCTKLELQPKDKYADLDNLVSTEVTVKSHDGTVVPLSLVHKKSIQLNGSNPCLLIGYGSYGAKLNPVLINQIYGKSLCAWYEQGGMLAISHVRGGGEKGEEWYRAGFQRTKPNTWKDFISCAEYLIEQRYTSPARLAGEGISAGGILIGRAVTERPDLFGVMISRVGILNAVRFMTTSNGVTNVPEFGSCNTEVGFRSLCAMDAFLHISDGVKYPAMLITHGISDPRVEPWQSAKFAARVQDASISNKPILLRMNYEAGHGIGSTKIHQIQEHADIFGFIMWQFGLENSN